MAFDDPEFCNIVGEMRSALAALSARLLEVAGNGPREGASSAMQLAYLVSIARRDQARRIVEIGFNTGSSSYALLWSHPDARVISFDIGWHPYVLPAKRYIDERFPGRHMLIIGDSASTVPQLAQQTNDPACDLAFIDGGHNYDTVAADLRNVRLICRSGASVIIDDLTPWTPWGRGPTRAWTDVMTRGEVTQEELLRQRDIGGPLERVPVIEPPARKVWALGRYT